jgi:hypothetical protein
MGTPNNLTEYARFDIDGLTLYVAWALLEKMEDGATEQPFYIDGYGRYMLVFKNLAEDEPCL